MTDLRPFPHKALRARAIAAWLQRAGLRGAVCFSSGNAARALLDAGVDTVCVGPGFGLVPGRWWTTCEIRRTWPDRLDATPGHLPVDLVAECGAAYRDHLGDRLSADVHPGPYRVRCGSGETLVALALAYPCAGFVACYDDHDLATRWSPEAPLNALVDRLAVRVDRRLVDLGDNPRRRRTR